jgi:DNA-binding MarR family transcriptional regulator
MSLPTDPDPPEVAAALRASVGLHVRRLRQVQVEGELTLSESSALANLVTDGPTTSAELARRGRISPQSMGATLAGLEARGLIERSPDPADGRRVLLSLTPAGRRTRASRKAARTEQLATVLVKDFTAEELRQLQVASTLLERLAQGL